jgi:hypothetical protein
VNIIKFDSLTGGYYCIHRHPNNDTSVGQFWCGKHGWRNATKQNVKIHVRYRLKKSAENAAEVLRSPAWARDCP